MTSTSTSTSLVPEFRSRRAARRAADRLGWFSIGLGLASLLAPRAMARTTGLQGHETWVRLLGVREIAVGVGILTARRQGPWLWARVAGDAIDLARLGSYSRGGTDTHVALAAVAAITVVDVGCAQGLTRAEAAGPAPRHDYARRRGLPLPPDEMRGAALADFVPPADMVTPEALRPYVLQ